MIQIILCLILCMNPLFSKTVRYFNGRVLRQHELQSGDLWVSNGKIVPPQPTADEEIDAGGRIISPGYIDLQINGAFGVDFSLCPERTPEVCLKLPRFGVTSFLPTVISTPKELYPGIIAHLQPRPGSPQTGASVLGIHLEGPFFNPAFSAAHDPAALSTCDADYYGSLEGVKIVTLAPEISGGFEMISWLREQGIVVSIGHSNASYEETLLAIEKGCSLATHLFNAMRPLHHRSPGIIGAALGFPRLAYSIIVDGAHHHPAAIQLAWAGNPDGLILISDAISLFGGSSGECRLGTVAVEAVDGKAYVKGTKTLAGSLLSMDAAVRNLRAFTGCSIVEALEAATLKPARLLGIESAKGTLGPGADADFLFLDDELNVKSCYISGELIWADQ